MRLKWVTLLASLTLVCACDSDKPADKPVPPSVSTSQLTANENAVSATDDQKFSYLLGTQYGPPIYVNVPNEIGEMLEMDAMVQGINDDVKKYKDSTFKLQMTPEKIREVDSLYAKKIEGRRAAGDNAADVKLAGPITGKPMTIDENSPDIMKYSYMMGVQLGEMFISTWKNFEQEFDVNFYVMGIREGIANMVNPSAKTTFTMDELKTIHSSYKKKIEAIMDVRRSKG